MEAIEEAYGKLCNVLTFTPMQKVWTLKDNVNDSAREQMGAQYGGPEWGSIDSTFHFPQSSYFMGLTLSLFINGYCWDIAFPEK